jgi:tetratricopeptide (TPR) repeat protein
MGWFWYVGTLVPVIGLVQVGEQAMADRYTYVPTIGIFVAIAWGLRDLIHVGVSQSNTESNWRVRAIAVATVGLLLVLTLQTRAQVTYWSNTISLYEHALAVDPNNYVAHNNAAVALYAAGRKDEALAHYERAVAIKPGFSDAQMNLGAVLAEKGKTAEAIQHYEWALKLKPENAKALNNLALALASEGHLEEAIKKWEDAVRIQPDYVDAHSNLGVALARVGRVDAAIEQFEAALRINPENVNARANLEKIRARVGGQPRGEVRP